MYVGIYVYMYVFVDIFQEQRNYFEIKSQMRVCLAFRQITMFTANLRTYILYTYIYKCVCIFTTRYGSLYILIVARKFQRCWIIA